MYSEKVKFKRAKKKKTQKLYQCYQLLKILLVKLTLTQRKTGGTLELKSILSHCWASQVALVVKLIPANAGDIRDVCLIPGSRRSLEKGMATHSSKSNPLKN